MKQFFTFCMFIFIFSGCKNENRDNENLPEEEMQSEISEAAEKVERDRESLNIDIDPIEHGTAVITWDDAVFYLDPVGGADAFEGKDAPDFILITDIHGDHLSPETLQEMGLEDIMVFGPQAVRDELPSELRDRITVMDNGATVEIMDFTIKAMPMYNLPENDPESFHEKGRGNGYLLEKDDTRFYISGDTEDIPEMRNLEDIDMAMVAMNLPYTMSIEQAVDAVLDFEPKKVYPYHFRGQDGFADVEKFKEMVEEENNQIDVVLLDWYPEKD